MSAPRAAIRYAKSLFSLAAERGEVERMEQDIRALHQVVAGSHDLGMMLKSPVIKPDTKAAILAQIFQDHLGELTMDFLRVLVRKGRESMLPAITDAALGLIRSMRNTQVAEVRTAFPMDDAVRERVAEVLKTMHQGEVELEENVDTSLIGGFQLFMDNRMVDASLKRELDLLRRRVTDHDYEPGF